MKFLEDNIRAYLSELELNRDFLRAHTKKSLATKQKTDELHNIKINYFYLLIETIRRKKGKPQRRSYM